MNDERIEIIRNKYGLPFHYYGDNVRALFVISALLMLGTLPFLASKLPVPSFVSILVIVAVTIIAGFVAPRSKSSIVLDFIVAVAGLFAFEYYALESYTNYSELNALFVINQILAILFLFASYYATKTVRSLFNKTTDLR